jgi:predicted nucleic acid-binding Zn ribbon protein
VQEAPPKPPPGPPAPAGTRCAVCGTPHEPGQEFCLSCGNRLTSHYRRPPSWRLVAGVAAAAVLAIGAGVGAAIGLSSGGHDKTPVQTTLTTQGAAAPAPAPTASAPTTPSLPTASTPVTPTKPQTKTTPQAGGTPGPTPGKPSKPQPKIAGVASWPLTKTAYTADLFETPSPQTANKKAKAAVKKGIPAGVLLSDFYKTLPSGLYVVFAGQYKTSQEATAAANKYAGQGFGAAYARLIQPKQ